MLEGTCDAKFSQAGRDTFLALGDVAPSWTIEEGGPIWQRFVSIIPFDDALILYALVTRFGRHGEAAWRGQDDTERTRAAFRAHEGQIAFRHQSQLCERPALLAYKIARGHRPPTSGQNATCGGRVRRDYGNYTSSQLGRERH
jgi:hypothetical protein